MNTAAHGCGAKAHSTSEEVREQLTPLLCGFEERRCVPFLGAGISATAEYDSPEPSETLHDTSVMTQRIAVRLAAELHSAPEDERSAWPEYVWNDLAWPPDELTTTWNGCEHHPKCETDERSKARCIRWQTAEVAHSMVFDGHTEPRANWTLLDRVKEPLDKFIDHVGKQRAPLNRLAEHLFQRCGYIAVCETLQIERFCDLQPTPAHFVLARLIVEDRIAEIITTNYDLCLERAVALTLGNSDNRCTAHSYQEALSVIIDAHGYMGTVEQRTDKAPPSVVCSTPQARYYKINGCAWTWRRAYEAWTNGPSCNSPDTTRGVTAAAQQIILTERQLQSFRERDWAEGLFRDRARSRQLVFSGFGSEEPQVRHTALAVAAEFERSGNADHLDPWRLGAAPWFHAYEPNLSFYQMQVLLGWWYAWRSEPPPREAHADPRNWIGGGTGCAVRALALVPDGNAPEKTNKNKLSADDFWCAVLFELWRRDIERELAPQAPLFNRLVMRASTQSGDHTTRSDTESRLALVHMRDQLLKVWACTAQTDRQRESSTLGTLRKRRPFRAGQRLIPAFVQLPADAEMRVCCLLLLLQADAPSLTSFADRHGYDQLQVVGELPQPNSSHCSWSAGRLTVRARSPQTARDRRRNDRDRASNDREKPRQSGIDAKRRVELTFEDAVVELLRFEVFKTRRTQKPPDRNPDEKPTTPRSEALPWMEFAYVRNRDARRASRSTWRDRREFQNDHE